MANGISRVELAQGLLAAILARAAADPEREVCGLLLGTVGIDGGAVVTAAPPAANVAAWPETRFELDPAALIAAHRAARQGGPAVLGHYHSHPRGGAAPSPRDAAMALDDGALWLICTPDGRHALWRAGASGRHGRFQRCALETR